MDQQNNVTSILAQAMSFRTTVRCSLPADGKDVRRPFEFEAEFELMDQKEWEDMVSESSKSEALNAVLRSVSSPQLTTVNINGVELTPRDQVVRNPIACDAAFTAYSLYVSEDGRRAAVAAGDRKNYKRSRQR